MTQDRLNELKTDCEFAIKHGHFIPQTDTADILALIDKELAKLADPGEQSDGYHTFNDMYHQRAILFASLSRAYADKAWKSLKHHDGTMFDGGWFICGIETPEGQYTYHYKLSYWPLFAGKVLDNAPEWDGHTEDDVTRLMSLYPMKPVSQPCAACSKPGEWKAELVQVAGPNRTRSFGIKVRCCPQCGKPLTEGCDNHEIR